MSFLDLLGICSIGREFFLKLPNVTELVCINLLLM